MADVNELYIDDLRPHLAKLNWQLRRIGLGVAVECDARSGAVNLAKIVPTMMQSVFCDNCGKQFHAGREKFPACPKCGKIEHG